MGSDDELDWGLIISSLSIGFERRAERWKGWEGWIAHASERPAESGWLTEHVRADGVGYGHMGMELTHTVRTFGPSGAQELTRDKTWSRRHAPHICMYMPTVRTWKVSTVRFLIGV